MKYDRLYEHAFEEMVMGPGIMATEFDPETGVADGILGATSGGLKFSDTLNTSDFGSDIDNCPPNTMEMMQVDGHNATLNGELVTLNQEMITRLIGAGIIDPENVNHIIPVSDLKPSMFKTFWVVCNYSNNNEGDNAGFVAIRLMNAINTGGFSLTTQDRSKAKLPFTFTACYSMKNPDQVPYEVFFGGNKKPEEITIEVEPKTLSLDLDSHNTDTLTVKTNAAETVTWKSSATEYATVDETGETVTVTAVDAGTATITASVTVDGQEYSAECAVTVEGV